MNLSWLFNGTMEAHHLLAAYVFVWLVQGGYVGWITLRWRALKSRLPQTPIHEPEPHS